VPTFIVTPSRLVQPDPISSRVGSPRDIEILRRPAERRNGEITQLGPIRCAR
jgi:hypothetical protein